MKRIVTAVERVRGRQERLGTVREVADGDKPRQQLLEELADLRGRVAELEGAIAQDAADRRHAEEAVRKLSRAVEQSPATVVITDTRGDIEYVNPKFTLLTGYSFEEALGKNPSILKSGETPSEEYRALWETITAGGEWRGEFHNKKRNGELYWEFASISPIFDSRGAITHYIAVKEDITERKKAEDALRESEGRYRTLAEAAQDAIFIVGRDDRIQYVNGFAARQLGVSQEQIVGKAADAVFPPALSSQQKLNRVKVFETGEPVYCEERVLFQRGEAWLYTCLAPLRDKSGQISAVLGISRDITDLIRMREELRALSLVDELTGLYNRRGFLTLAQQHLTLADRTRRRAVLLLADLDRMKWINDTLGHHEGDLALVAAAGILRATLRRSDVIARIGGDEFVVLAMGNPEVDLEPLERRLQETIDAHNAAAHRPYRLSISVGMVEREPGSQFSLDELLAQADERMYGQKQEKRRRGETR